jgi:hypothetical protein
MLRKLSLLFVSSLLVVCSAFAQTGQGTLKGSVLDGKTKEPIPFANIVMTQDGEMKGGATTDFDGKFILNSLSPGKYDVEIKYVGYKTTKYEGVIINANKIRFLDNIELGQGGEMLEEVEIIKYKVPLIDKDGGPSGGTVTREDIARLPVRDATGVAKTVGGVYSNESGDLSIRGSRSGDTYYYIDGIKVRGSSSLPKSAIEEVSVITGGLPANYGDATGGIISITTRGPSARYFGSIEGVTSGFYFKGDDPDGYDGRAYGLDRYAYNLVEGMISGPIIRKKDSTGKKGAPLLGFFLSGNYTDVVDGRPLGGGGDYRIKKDVRDELLANPLRPTGTGLGVIHNANYLTENDFEQSKHRMNARSRSASMAGKIDVNAGPSVNLTFGGSMNWDKRASYSRNNSLLNFTNFGESKSLDWRVYGRFTHRFSNKNKKDSKSKIKSAYYSLMVDYSKTKRDFYDPKHEHNYFNYGYVGKFDTEREESYEFNDGNDTMYHNGFRDTYVNFTPSETNSALAAITSQYYDIYEGVPFGFFQNLNQINQNGALRNGDTPGNVYGLWTNIGNPYDFFGKSETDQVRVSGMGAINIGDHAISLGFEYEQRWDRGFQSGQRGPSSLWTIARQYANSHIAELNTTSNVEYENFGSFIRVTYDRLNTGQGALTGSYGGQQESDAQFFFDYNLRNELGLDPFGTDFVNIDNVDPNILSFEMFSPDELFNSGNNYVQYWGYDHTGTKTNGVTDIDKYFTEYDDNGNYKRSIGAFQPIYVSGYIMDKFAFEDIVFNVGVRVDMFDANQPVLKDKYLLYNARTAGDVSAINGNPISHPGGIGDDYVVYVNTEDNPTQINGYRNGDVWYDAKGVEIADPTLITGSAGVTPYLVNPGQTSPSGDAFKDYKPQINVMPRISFSFPISDKASFFAHYDILTQRPSTGNRFDPIDYQFMAVRNTIINNPELKPEKTIDYELGFQQVVTPTSSIKISAFYREQRDQVQLMNVFEAYPSTYRTYGNRDFGTVKGITIAYDLRRTGNVRLTAAYTLQFADGTGSNAGSALSLVNSGQPNLRNIFPYDYDQRHGFNITFDYRFGDGKDYNGPTTKKGGQWLKNTGLNMVANIGSGTPYSRQQTITDAALINPAVSSGLQGLLNGSRKPWTYTLDMQIDHSIALSMGKKENEKKKKGYLNIYLRVTNIFNTLNVLNVYRATGNASDDGYLAASQFQSSIQSQLDEQSFRDLYAIKANNPYNYGIPRTIRLGIKFDF